MSKVLIVDDSDIVRDIMKHCLAGHYELAFAENSEQAFGKIATFAPDALVLDMHMPGGMSGYDLCKLIKSIEQFKHIYILMVTGDWHFVQAAGDDFKADNYIFKPFTQGTVLHALLKVLPPLET